MNASFQPFERLTLIGIGLIGSSLAHIARQRSLAKEIAITTRSAATLELARELDLGTSYHMDMVDAVRGADLIIMCVPVGACEMIAKRIAPALKTGAIVSDVGSVKESVITQVMPYMPDGVHFVPAHPIAGTEHSGPDAGFAELFTNRWCILTPIANTPPEIIDRLADFWRHAGSMIEVMDAKHHDMVLAITSHLPHLIAYNIVRTAEDLESVTQAEVIKFSASGFRDFTRLAASDPIMWRDVFLHNREAALEMLSRFSEDLTELRRAVRWRDGDKLLDLFTRTRHIRRSIIEAGQETAKPDFGRHRKPNDKKDNEKITDVDSIE